MSKIVILTGAGISAESGIDTFRAEDGLWAQHRVEDVATPEGFARDPQLVVDFYNGRRKQAAEVSPNAAHQALARLQANYAGQVVIVTPKLVTPKRVDQYALPTDVFVPPSDIDQYLMGFLEHKPPRNRNAREQENEDSKDTSSRGGLHGKFGHQIREVAHNE